MVSGVRNDNQSMITYQWYNNDPEQAGNLTIRLIKPGDTYGTDWGHHLIGMKVL
jgi:hypothetical protein